jgi:O-antigen/teichoic acid export membrane protein
VPINIASIEPIAPPQTPPDRRVSRRSATLASLAGGVASTFVSSLGALIIVPLCLSAVGPKLYGAWLASGDVLSWVQSFDLGLPNLMIQRIAVAHAKGDSKAVAEYFATGVAVLGIVALTIATALIVAAPLIPSWLGLQAEEAQLLCGCLRLGTIASSLALWNYTVIGYSRAVQRTAFLNAVAMVSNTVGLIVTLGLILAGIGIWSIPVGMCARVAVSVIGSLVFLVLRRKEGLFEHFHVRYAVGVEMACMSPATALGGYAYAVASQSENALVGIMLRPEIVPVLALTRKGADVIRSLLDGIAFSSYGGFAHLVGSDQRQRAYQVYAEIISLNLTLGIAAATVFVALNPSFVARWVGDAMFGGSWLNIAIATQMTILSLYFLVNYLYRATGHVLKGSVVLAVEAAVKIPLIVCLLRSFGLIAIPLASILTASLALIFALKWTKLELSSFSKPVRLFSWRSIASKLSLFIAGAVACFVVCRPSWPFIIASGTTVFAASLSLLLIADPFVVGSIRSSLSRMFPTFFLGAEGKRIYENHSKY